MAKVGDVKRNGPVYGAPRTVPSSSGHRNTVLVATLSRTRHPRALIRARRSQPQPTRSRRFGGKERSTTQCKQRQGRGRPQLTAAAARVLAALCCRSRTLTLRALAKRSVGRSFVRSAGRRVLRGGRHRAALPAPLHAAPLVHSSRQAGGGSRSLRNACSATHGVRAAFVGARALLDPSLPLLAADRGSSQRRLGARLRRCARPRGGALARRRLAMPALTAAQTSAASALGCVAALVRTAALSLAAGSPCRRRLTLAARCISIAHGARVVFAGARALLDPTLALLAADCGSSQRRLGARLRRCARPRGGALARRRLAMPAVARARCAMHRASLMAPVPCSSVLVLFSTRPSLCSPLTAAQTSATSAIGCVAALVRTAALSLAAGSPCRRRLALAARCIRVAHGARAAFAGARALLDPALALLAADCGSSQRRLGARLRRRAQPHGGALARRRLAMLAAARARCAMHATSPVAPVLRSSVLALSSTRPIPR